MNRFRAADYVSSSAPISDSAKSIKVPVSDPEKQDAKLEEIQEYVDAPAIHLEDEKFEWREVRRGKVFYWSRFLLYG